VAIFQLQAVTVQAMTVQAMTVHMPAEWEPPECVWLAWPHNLETWPGRFEPIPRFYARWIRLIAESTPVRVLAPEHLAPQCKHALQDIRNVELVDIPTNDCWIRDYGPCFVRDQADGSIHGVSWQYNAWGGKYPPWDLDDAAAAKICRAAGLRCVEGALCLEGGALESDGHGRLITTSSCLLTPTRNPGESEDTITQQLHQRLGVTEIVWLDGGGLAGDDTDGHIDQLARFVDRQNVVVAVCDDVAEENQASLETNYRQLHLWGDATSPNITLHRLPIPPARSIGQKRLPESYCNFMRLGKERMLVPTFGAPSDDHALGLLRDLSGSDVVGVDCRELVWGLGSLHCASREQPSG
jgi:agmatine deiminase